MPLFTKVVLSIAFNTTPTVCSAAHAVAEGADLQAQDLAALSGAVHRFGSPTR
jgi:hypothetical protein